MTDLLIPGWQRGEEYFSDGALMTALLRVEQAWLDEYAARGVVAATDLPAASTVDVSTIGGNSERGGNPVIDLVALLRTRLREQGQDDAATWLHRGLTSQDVLDTALMLCAKDALAAVRADLVTQIQHLVGLADRHRTTLRVARTLTQHAVPTTFGLVAAGWLSGLLDVADRLDANADLPAQIGGAAGTLSALSRMCDDATGFATSAAHRLGLRAALPWHSQRSTVTALGDAFASCHDAWGPIANDVLLAARPEVAELAEGVSGASSTMPHKQNPVQSVLVRRSGLIAPGLAATLHTAAAAQVDQRADGGWHAEWPVLRDLARHTVTVASLMTDLLGGLVVNDTVMAHRAEQARADLLAEAGSLPDSDAPLPTNPADYLGEADAFITLVLERAATYAPTTVQETTS